MTASFEATLHAQLVERRDRLAGAIGDVGGAPDLVRLLRDVDAALERVSGHAGSLCVVCDEPVQEELLRATPLARYCLCDLSDDQQRALEKDLSLASRVQWGLLPPTDLRAAGYSVHFRYDPVGPVSGDYVDLVVDDADPSAFHFLFGDVSGKGVAAAFAMARLNALFRSLLATGLAVPQVVERANGFLARHSLATQYATLVAGRAGGDGALDLCNAGHCPPLRLHGGDVSPVEPSGLPVGLLPAGVYRQERIALAPGDSLVLYTDGITEARDKNDEEYGEERLERVLREAAGRPPRALAAACLADLAAFLGTEPRCDDVTLMVIRRD